MLRELHPLRIFTTLRRLAGRGDGPSNVAVFHEGRLLYASFHDGQEQIIDTRVHDRLTLITFFLDWVYSPPLQLPPRRRTGPPSAASQPTGTTEPEPFPLVRPPAEI